MEGWTHNRLHKGEVVMTEYGKGIVVEIDLPETKAWRWMIKITEPIKEHLLIGQDKPLAFFDKEVTKVALEAEQQHNTGVYV